MELVQRGPVIQLLAFIAGEFLRPVTQERRQTEDTKCTKDKHSISHSKKSAALKYSLSASLFQSGGAKSTGE